MFFSSYLIFIKMFLLDVHNFLQIFVLWGISSNILSPVFLLSCPRSCSNLALILSILSSFQILSNITLITFPPVSDYTDLLYTHLPVIIFPISDFSIQRKLSPFNFLLNFTHLDLLPNLGVRMKNGKIETEPKYQILSRLTFIYVQCRILTNFFLIISIT